MVVTVKKPILMCKCKSKYGLPCQFPAMFEGRCWLHDEKFQEEGDEK